MWNTSSAAYIVPPPPGHSDAWTRETQGRGQQLIEILRAAVLPCDVEEKVKEVLNTAWFVARRRLLTVDGRPVEIATSFYPASIAEGTALAEPKPIKGGAVRLLADLGWTAARVVEDVGAIAADKEQADLLRVPIGSPLLVMHRTARNPDDEPFEYQHTVACDGRLQRYVMEVA